MTTIKIIRIEHKITGIGMYSGIEPHMLPDSRHALPWHDSLLWHGLCDAADSEYRPDVVVCMSAYRFGFASVIQARYWLYNPAWLVSMHALGYMARVYACRPDDVIMGDSQAIFCAGGLVGQESLLSLM